MTEIIKDASTLNFADYNPRIMREHDDTSLGNSMTQLGDIAGITYNMQTSTLVTGHQRLRKLKEKYGERVKVYIEQKFSDPDEYGTVGIGFIGVEGTTVRFAYREVFWDRGLEMAANYAANHIGGDDDKEKVAKVDYELSQLDNGDELLKLTGQTDKQVEKLLQSIGVGPEPELPPEGPQEDPADDKLVFAITKDQKTVIQQALGIVKRTREIQHTDAKALDGAALYILAADYIAAHPEPVAQPGELTDIPV